MRLLITDRGQQAPVQIVLFASLLERGTIATETCVDVGCQRQRALRVDLVDVPEVAILDARHFLAAERVEEFRGGVAEAGVLTAPECPGDVKGIGHGEYGDRRSAV